MRYIIQLIPLLLIAIAYYIAVTYKKNKIFAIAILIFLLIINIPFLKVSLENATDANLNVNMLFYSHYYNDAVWNGRFSILPINYLEEIIGPKTDDINTCLIDYLLEEEIENKTIRLSYHDLPIIFYTDMHVTKCYRWMAKEQCSKFYNTSYFTDWIYVKDIDQDILTQEMKNFMNEYYEEINLNCTETDFGNIPDIENHLFTIPESNNSIILYALKAE